MRQNWKFLNNVLLISATVIALSLMTFSMAWAKEESEASPFNAQNTASFDRPVAVAINDQGHVHVADSGSNRIIVLAPDGKYVTEWGGLGSGDGQFSYPSGIAFDSDGHVYVVDRDNHRIQKFDTSGSYLAEWGSPGNEEGEFRNPSGITVSHNGIVYVTDRDNHRIQSFDSDGNFLGQWGSYGDGDGEFNRPYGVAVDDDGNVYTTESENHRVQKFSADGSYVSQWGSQGDGDSQFQYPFSIAIENVNSYIYVPDAQNHRIQKFDLEGNFLAEWGQSGDGNGQFNFPNGVAIDSDGNVYVSEASNHQIQKFDSDGNFLNRWSGAVSVPESPRNVTAEPGNGQATVTFDPPLFDGNQPITSYEVTTYPGEHTTVGTESPMTVGGLTNGESYTFTVRASNSAGSSAESSASDSTIPFAETMTVTLDAQGGSVDYDELTKQYGATYGQGSDGVTVEALPNPKREGYAFKGWYTEPNGAGTVVTNSTKVTSEEDHTLFADWTLLHSEPPFPDDEKEEGTEKKERKERKKKEEQKEQEGPEEPEKYVDIYFNGTVVDAGIFSTKEMKGQQQSILIIDAGKLDDLLVTAGPAPVLELSLEGSFDTFIGKLNGHTLHQLATKQGRIEIQTNHFTYVVPAAAINVEALTSSLENSASLNEVSVEIEISSPSSEVIEAMTRRNEKESLEWITPPLEYSVRGIYENQSRLITNFDAYVEHWVNISPPKETGKFLTGALINADGNIHHVPTKIVYQNGESYAVLSSTYGGMFAVVSREVALNDIAGHWSEAAVQDMANRGIISGIGKDQFEPNRNITRAEFASILVRALGLQASIETSSFHDVKESSWYSQAIKTAYDNGLIQGFEDGTFRPAEAITREQAMVIIAKGMEITGMEEYVSEPIHENVLEPFEDQREVAAWARRSAATSIQAELLEGRSAAILAPKETITRAEVAVMIQRLLKKSNLI
ncbi:S-layer homology domain-containing protein [Aureibacillus halotolerans]|uniref:Putative repeat protein (TIGR02543 family) n=1 Tax=Aureibacillus halotolerans TaxID=1508390 RepID=A0A4R6U313_9BACI|nr:S-layer homology domain-containing protein [Aureibacillus halotolerans]TDQ40391.1 putative repeat protein (TIGR02543 family) [Aureibacillus halotolerans]